MGANSAISHQHYWVSGSCRTDVITFAPEPLVSMTALSHAGQIERENHQGPAAEMGQSSIVLALLRDSWQQHLVSGNVVRIRPESRGLE